MNEELQHAIRASVDALLQSGDWASYQATIIESLRSEIQRQVDVSHVRFCSSGSLAVELALRGIGIRDGDEVICCALDYPGNIRAIRLLGAVPVVVDTLPGRWTIDAAQVAAAGSDKTKAVLVSHLYGEVADVKRLRDVCDQHGWALIEDVCQMPAARIDTKPLGSFGHVAAFSFGGSKPLTAGCGGAVVTCDDRIAQRITTYADRPSDCFAISPLQAAVLLPQWQRAHELAQQQAALVRQLINSCRPATRNWTWHDESLTTLDTCYYKVPFLISPATCDRNANEADNAVERNGGIDAAKTSEQRDRLIQKLSDAGIRAGESFRVIKKSIAGRGRIVSFENADAMTMRGVLLDHRNLAGPSHCLHALSKQLIALHDQCEKGSMRKGV
jgi:perosamine synthetase